MSNQIQFQSFNFKSNAVRVITDPNQEPWFCGSDVCDILGYSNSRKALQDHCKQSGVTKRYISYPSGRKEAIFINEPNLYRLIIKSRKPEAEPFEAWVFEEVLPQIRKTGQYQLQQQLALPEPETQYPFEFTENELQTLAWAFFILLRNADTFRAILPALEKLGSTITPSIYGQAFDYHSVIKDMHRIVEKLTANFEFDPNSNWRVLEHVRNFNPKAKAYIAN